MVLIGILLLFNLYNHGNLFITNCILLISLIPLSYTNFNLAILENKKLSGTITIVNCILFLFNLLLDLFLIYCCPHNAVLMVAVSTLLTRLLECWLLYYLTYIKLNLSIKPLLKWRVCVDMWAWTNANLLTSSVFIMSIAVMVYFVKNHFHSQDVAAIGICLNYLNNLSVLVTGLVITLIISFNQISIATIKQFIVYYLFLFVSLSFISSFIFHFLYNPQGLLVYLKKHFLLSQVILLFDLLTNIAVTLLRLNGIKTAPLFKLTFPLIGIPLGIGLAYYLNDLDYILYGFIFGNFLSLFLSSGQYMLLQAKNH
jgi:hypothetical protein